MFVWIAKVTMVLQYILYRAKQGIQQKTMSLSELKGNYTYDQVWCPMIATQSTNIDFKLLTVIESNCAICVI